MTDRERAIVMAYTGVVMLKKDKLEIFYDYLSEKFGRKVYTHEIPFLIVTEKIKEVSYEDFIKLCA